MSRQDELIESEELHEMLIRQLVKLTLDIVDHPTCSQEIKDIVEKRAGVINPLFRDYIGVEITPPKLINDGKDWELGIIKFKNGMRIPFVGSYIFYDH